MSPPRRVAVVGGGIAGLSAALTLAEAGIEVVVHEAGERFGGKIETGVVGGRAVEAGPDAFLARVPQGAALAGRVGLTDQLVTPAATSAGLWLRGQVRALPEGLVLGVPARLGPLARSGLVSRRGLARAALEPLLPATPVGDDIGVGVLVRSRFGREVAATLVDPLLGGINAGRSDELSLALGAPQLEAVARGNRSLLVGLRKVRAAAAGAPHAPVFLTVRDGLSTLVEHVVDALRQCGVELRPSAPVVDLDDLDADAVVLAAPAGAAGDLLRGHCGAAADILAATTTSSVVLVTLLLPDAALAAPLVGSGFLVPRAEGRLMTACSYGSNKWPHWAAPGTAVLRVSAGRVGDERSAALGDDDLVSRLLDELRQAIGLRGDPIETHVRRWPEAFPQLAPGHRGRMATAAAALRRDAPHLALAGAVVRGVGIPACIGSGTDAAAALLGGPRS